MKRISLLLFGLIFYSSSVLGQNPNDKILFTVADEEIPVSEFLYIYKKNLGNNADFSRKSMQEYLDLYMKFKLKVKKARSMKIDTSPSFKREMKGYRDQLAKSYLVDKEVNEKLIREAYERKKKDLKISHILINTGPNNKFEEKAILKINEIDNDLKNGKSFKSIARAQSDDKYSNKYGGDLGWVTSMLPEGFYEFENYIYNLKVGEHSKPFKSKFGYHIVKLDDERPARGEVEASHILIREKVKGKPVPNAKKIIDSLYSELKKGQNFVNLARKYSMDDKTAMKGGYLGFFGINKYDKTFEDAVFALEKNREISKPFKTSIGWHIVKLNSKIGIKSFDKVKRNLSNKINENERYNIARKSLIVRIKAEAGFKKNENVLTGFADKLDKSFYSFKWKAPKYEDEKLVTLGNKEYTLKDFVNYCTKNQRSRLKLSKKSPLNESMMEMFDGFVDDLCISYEEQHLEEKYPDFKFLMREYTEGNLLFEVMEKEVWNKASKDTTGLKVFYGNNNNRYQWKERAELYEYSIHSDDQKLIKKVLKYAKKKSHDKLIKKYNKKKQQITFKAKKVEVGDKELEGLIFEKGVSTEPFNDKELKVVTFKKINNILPVSSKSLDEAKGYIIADYQEYLEKKWIIDLEKQYPTKLNEDVFNSIVK